MSKKICELCSEIKESVERMKDWYGSIRQFCPECRIKVQNTINATKYQYPQSQIEALKRLGRIK